MGLGRVVVAFVLACLHFLFKWIFAFIYVEGG